MEKVIKDVIDAIAEIVDREISEQQKAVADSKARGDAPARLIVDNSALRAKQD